MRKTWSIFVLLFLFAQIGWSQANLIGCSPSQAVGRPYSGTITVTGSNTLFNNATAGINLRLTHSGSGTFYDFGSAPTLAGWGTIMSNTSITGAISLPGNAPTGFYNVQLNGFEGNWFTQIFSYTGSSLFELLPDEAYFEGSVISDMDSNCVTGVGDIGIPNQTVTVTPGPYYALTDVNGDFTVNIPTGTYTFSVAHPPGATIICPSTPFTQTATVSVAGDTTRGIDFYAKSLHTTDIFAHVVIGAHRPGFNNGQAYISMQNNTPTAASNVVLKIVKPNILSYVSFSPSSPTTVVGDTATYVVGNLAPYASFDVTVIDSTPLNSWGSQITYSAFVSTSSQESSISNNVDSSSILVTGSYDPNDKQVWTASGTNADGFIDTSDVMLRYLIRFQNTGNDTAFNIQIRDTLDSNLDLQSLTVLGSSHPSYVQSGLGANNQIAFQFDNILLPDSNINEELSHGWVEYTINRNAGLPIGTTIENTAHIYFDFNAPIVTNTVSSEICPPLDTNSTFSTTGLTTTFLSNSAGGANSWAWDFGDSQTGSGMNPSHTYASSGTYNVCLTIMNPCGRSENTCFPIVINCPPPVAGFGQSLNNLSATFNDLSGNSPTAWFWDFGDSQTSTLANPTHTYAGDGTYWVCLITTNACGMDTTCDSITVTCPMPNSMFSSTTNLLSASFSDLSTGAPSTWAWTFGDGNISAQPSPSHTYASSGTYEVCLTTTNSCGPHTICDSITVVNVGTSSPFWTNAYLAPNPANKIVTLHLEGIVLDQLDLTLQDALGRKIRQWKHQNIKGDFRHAMSTEALPDGIYFLKMSSVNWNQTMRLIVNHD